MLLYTPTSSNTPCIPSVTVVVKSGSIKEDIIFTVTGEGIYTEGDINTYVIHFSVPPSKWWVDVRFACSTTQVFRDKVEMIEWVSNMSLRSSTRFVNDGDISVNSTASTKERRLTWRLCGN